MQYAIHNKTTEGEGKYAMIQRRKSAAPGSYSITDSKRIVQDVRPKPLGRITAKNAERDDALLGMFLLEVLK
ncbi:hypothetical protein KY362_01575 [Candidatus Woesearchaeota archaeon]|nr:hypothetical protein [Candidatus Woesearchaeota archaeon]